MERANETEPPDPPGRAPDTEPPEEFDLDHDEPATILVPPPGPPPGAEPGSEPESEPEPATVRVEVDAQTVFPEAPPEAAPAPARSLPVASGSPTGAIILLVLAAAALIGFAAWLIFVAW